jgi:glutathionylspermidine synthase
LKPFHDYNELAQKLYDSCIISDPWIDGKERFSLEPMVMSSKQYKQLCEASEKVGALYDEFSQIIWNHPDFLDDYFNLTPYQKLMWLSSNGDWHGIARLDLFILEDGSIQICEMNSDTPSGEAEAVLLNKIFEERYPSLKNPNRGFDEKFCSMIMGLFQSSVCELNKPAIGIVYPTEMPEDLSMISLYEKWFKEMGSDVVLGSPYNLRHLKNNELALFDTKIDILFRHYKTDWWGERLNVWTDEEDLPDTDPLDYQLRIILDAALTNNVTVINPFGSVLTQNKLSLAFFWENMELFTDESVRTIKNYIPETYRLITRLSEQNQKNDWVLKSDYGCEGDEVILGPLTNDDIWAESLEKAIPEHWVLQKFFNAKKHKDGSTPNYGVYLLAGAASGIFTRLSSGGTDYHAVTAATFIDN